MTCKGFIAFIFSFYMSSLVFGQAPSISWRFHKYDTIYLTDDEIELELEVGFTIETHSNLKSVVISMLNGKDGSVISQRNRTLSGSQFSFFDIINLPEDIINLKVEAADIEGRQTISTRTFTRNKALIERKIKNRKAHALIFATDNYRNWPPLVNPIFDANTFSEHLKFYYGFTTEIVENATEQQVVSKFKEYQSKTYDQFDQLLIFFAGHGGYNKFGGYLVANDSEVASDIHYKLEFQWIEREVNYIPANHILLVLDVCFSGAFGEPPPSVREDTPIMAGSNPIYGDASQFEMLKRKFARISRLLISSGGKDYVSDGIPGEHSPFMSRFLRALRSRGYNDNILTMAELKSEMEVLKTEPKFDRFGNHEPKGDFIFISTQN